MPTDHSPPQTQELVRFKLNGDDFALGVSSIREIRSWEKPTPLPETEAHIQGIMNLRGIIIPVLDLKTRIGFPASHADERSVTMIVEHAKGLVGFVVDAVSDIMTLPDTLLQDIPSNTDDTTTYIKRVALVEDTFIRILDVNAILSGSQLQTQS